MAAEADSLQVDNLKSIKKALTEDETGESVKVDAIHNLKKIFKPPDKVFQFVRMESIMENAWISLQYKTPEKGFLLKYGTALVDFLGKNASLDSRILHHLEFVLTELKKQDEGLANELATNLWKWFETNNTFPKEFLNVSKTVIERVVLDWLENSCRMEATARMAANCPELFQALTSILYQILVKSGGHDNILKMTQAFVCSVLSICQKEKKDFLELYPKDCRRLVSLLMVSPNVYAEGKEIGTKSVAELLVDLFRENRTRVLILLSHYPDWMTVLKSELEEG